MKKHVNIPIFIPHLGCPNQCVFCNQRTISGVNEFDISSVRGEIETALKTISSDQTAEIAFFGGSFTGIDRALMTELLKIANEYILSGKVASIRCSTRPDYIDDGIIEILQRYNVGTVELGLQSVSDRVLQFTKRGHSFEDEKRATRLLTDAGISLVGQMMIGLPGADLESEIETARFIIESGASGARIYPTVVFKDTELCLMAGAGAYSPISEEDAIERSAKVLRLFHDAGVEVIRVGLCAQDNLYDEDKYFAGPNHPALGEKIYSRAYLEMIKEKIKSVNNLGTRLCVYVARGELSKAIGQKKYNRECIIREYGFSDVRFYEDSALSRFELRIEEERKRECI